MEVGNGPKTNFYDSKIMKSHNITSNLQRCYCTWQELLTKSNCLLNLVRLLQIKFKYQQNNNQLSHTPVNKLLFKFNEFKANKFPTATGIVPN